MPAAALLVGGVISLLLWPAFILLTFVNGVFRLMISLAFSCTKYNLMYPGTDNIYQPSVNILELRNLILALESDREIDLAAERKRWSENVFGKHLPRYRKLMCTIIRKFGYGCLRDDSETFDLSQHVKYWDGQGNQDITEEYLMSEIVPKLTEDMPTIRPQWEWLIIPNILKSDGTKVHMRLFRGSHGYTDGSGLGCLVAEELFDWCLDLPKKRPPFIIDPRKDLPSHPMLTVSKMVSFLLVPFVIMTLTLQAVLRTKFVRQGIFRPHGQPTTPRFVCSRKHVELAGLKNRVSPKAGMNIDSICATGVKRALWKAVQSRKESKDENVQDVSLGILKARPSPNVNKQPSNNFFSANALLNFDEPQKPINVVWPLEAFVGPYAINWMGTMPLGFLTFLSPSCLLHSGYISNVPVTRVRGNICGNEVTQLHAWSAMTAVDMFSVYFFGYGGRMTCSVNCRLRGLDQKDAIDFADNIIEEINNFRVEEVV